MGGSRGFLFQYPYNDTITNNIAYGDSPIGFYLSCSDSGFNFIYNRMVNNTAFNDTEGFAMSACQNNSWVNNTAFNNSLGFYVDNSVDNVFSGNTAHDNAQEGFIIEGDGGSHYNSFIQSTAYNNAIAGILLTYGESGDRFSNTTLYNNTYDLGIDTNNTNPSGGLTTHRLARWASITP